LLRVSFQRNFFGTRLYFREYQEGDPIAKLREETLQIRTSETQA